MYIHYDIKNIHPFAPKIDPCFSNSVKRPIFYKKLHTNFPEKCSLCATMYPMSHRLCATV